jgi:hypothetical protein
MNDRDDNRFGWMSSGSPPGVFQNMQSLKQARVLRAMLHLGSFTAKEIAESVGEPDKYIWNLINEWKGKWLEEREPLRLGRVGAPEKVLFIKPEVEEAILNELSPVYEEDLKKHPATYRFVETGDSNETAYGEVQIVGSGRIQVREYCSAPTHLAGHINCVVLDSSRVAYGLAAAFRRTHAETREPVAIINVRDKVTHLAIVENGQVQFSMACRQGLDKSGGWAVNRLGEPIHAFEHSNETKVSRVYLTGNLEHLKSIRSAIKEILSVDCSVFDPTKGVKIDAPAEPRTGEITGVKWAAEIGYAVSQFEDQAGRWGRAEVASRLAKRLLPTAAKA